MKLGASKKNLEMKVCKINLKYVSVPKSLVYSKFIENQPELAAKHILKRVTQSSLKRHIMLTYKLPEKELKDNYGLFMREPA